MLTRRIVYFLIGVLILTGSVYALSMRDKEEEGIVNLESATLRYDFGSVEKDKVTKKIIKVRNSLDEALNIKSAESTCECILANVKPQKVKRGGVFELEITFDSKGLSKHQYLEELVYLITGNMEYELIRVVVLVEVDGPANN